ncbi:bifunctional enzyme of folate synthesis, putative [Plasmodium gallinaceum]|uniref:Bifunctional enzyme of folate synthesis, putative n=1 Tax=Plasmodium gallinaceum TaxID=5849 RepID=A0A1J1GYY8_PLAGA|nr:bifunctional enzyme of folate synthesis, putative [Plasmodium gallinaceum]CRG97677.1 bifunctional enzyme of folate synthesis, putative [Plasmodium gallinaceum]
MTNSVNSNKRNIAVLNFGTNDKDNSIVILETALYLVEKYVGNVINTSYIYETMPEYLILDETEITENITDETCENYEKKDISWLNEMIKTLESSRYEENNDLIHECYEFEKFLKNENLNESIINEVSVDDYEMESKNLIKKNDETFKKNLEKHERKYYTKYFYNIIVVVRSFVEDPLSMLIILKYIERLMGRQSIKNRLKFENRLIDIDILFFNSYTIFKKKIELDKQYVYKVISKYINIENCSNKNFEILETLKDEIEFLSIPHMYTKYRYSILLCLNDIIPQYKHKVLKEKISILYNNYVKNFENIHKINIKKNNKRIYVLKDKPLYLKEKTQIVGVLNVNYDSFSDGGLFVDPSKAVERIFEMINEGADIIDIGGESSSPFVVPNPKISERDLVIPVLKLFHQEWNKLESELEKNIIKPIISIDTVHYNIFKECVDENFVDILNDISACTNNPEIIKLLKKKSKYLSVVLMHKRGNPHTMDKLTDYNDIVYDIKNYLEDRLNFLVLNGIPRYRIILDIGLGFAKKHDQSIKLLKDIHVYDDYPLLIGYSRKRFITYCMEENNLTDRKKKMLEEEKSENENKTKEWEFKMNNMRKDKDQLLYQKNICGGLAIASYLFYKKVDLIRVHDILETKAVLDVLTKIHKS